MSYLFFFSYARYDDETGHLGKFYDDLVREVGDIAGHPRDQEIGFRDMSNIELGDSWPEALARALRTSRVFLYLHSPTYFTRDLCGKEWQVFHTRVEKYMELNPGCEAQPLLMVPVLWRTVFNLPECVRNIQYTHGDFGDTYATEGLHYLAKLKKHEDDYQIFLNRLAQRVVGAANETELPELDDLPDIRSVPNPFCLISGTTDDTCIVPRNTGPRYAQFVYVAARKNEICQIRTQVDAYGEEGGGDWRPYFPDYDEEIAITTQRIATEPTIMKMLCASLVADIRSL